MTCTISIACALFAFYYFRRYWLTPWATYVSHSVVKEHGYFLTVRHVHWFPPFLSYQSTYYRQESIAKDWAETDTGYVPSGYGYPHNAHQCSLDHILTCRLVRDIETEQYLK